MYRLPVLIISFVAVGCLSSPLMLQQQQDVQKSSTLGVIDGMEGTSIHLGDSEIMETSKTEILGKLQEDDSEKVKEEPKSGAYVVGTGVIGTPVVVATPVVHTGFVHRTYPHVGVGLGRVDVTRTETNIVSSGVY